MTVHLISVGVSMLEAMEHPGRKRLGDDLGQAFSRHQTFSTLTFGFSKSERDAASRWVTAILAQPGEPGHDPAQAKHLQAIAADLDIELWPERISAELETFRHAPQQNAFPLSPDDTAVLICSDTARGLLAGVWNAAGLTGGDFSRVSYLPGPGTAIGDVRGQVVIARVTGMDAANSADFTKAMSGLGALACRVLGSRHFTKVTGFRFYLSGGFKAAIPYLIGMAEAVRSLDETRLSELGVTGLTPGAVFPVKAFVMHEMSDPPEPIELPLRRLSTSAIRRELKDFTGGTSPLKPDYALLEGYAYEASPGGYGYTLTPFGAGLKTLFSMPAEGYGR